MTHSEIEMWALRVIEQVKMGQPDEDARVELKAKWPESTYKAARQIAAHANPAGGEPVLWIIGVDQTTGVVGAEHNELASWYSQVKSHFDEVAPDCTDVNIGIDGMTVVALLFNTERRLFVVKTQGGGPVTYEVPWRGTTSTRSAKRSELMGMLSTVRRLPKWEAISGELEVERIEQPPLPMEYNHQWQIRMKLYVTPEDSSRVCIPFHRCEGTLEFTDFGTKTGLRNIGLTYDAWEPETIRGTGTELIIEGPGMVALQAEARSTYMGVLPHTDGHVSIHLASASGGYPATVTAVFTFNEGKGHWTFRNSTH
jgi:hypothetical protein